MSTTVGIYKLEFGDGSVYIGQSIDIDSRIKSHRLDLSRGSHPNRSMQEVYDAYDGEMDVEVLEECEPDELNELEKGYIEQYDSFYGGLNQTRGGGTKRSTEKESKGGVWDKSWAPESFDTWPAYLQRRFIAATSRNGGKLSEDTVRQYEDEFHKSCTQTNTTMFLVGISLGILALMGIFILFS